MDVKIRVILQKSFEFYTSELEGTEINEKANDAIKKARARFDQMLKSGSSKVLIEDKVIINPRR